MSKKIGSALKSALALGLAASVVTAVAMPAQAGDGGAIAAGIIGGTALGIMAGAAAAGAAPPPPPPPYYAPGPAYYAPGPRCWFERRRIWDDDGDGYVVRRVRVCN